MSIIYIFVVQVLANSFISTVIPECPAFGAIYINSPMYTLSLDSLLVLSQPIGRVLRAPLCATSSSQKLAVSDRAPRYTCPNTYS